MAVPSVEELPFYDGDDHDPSIREERRERAEYTERIVRTSVAGAHPTENRFSCERRTLRTCNVYDNYRRPMVPVNPNHRG